MKYYVAAFLIGLSIYCMKTGSFFAAIFLILAMLLVLLIED